MRSEDEAIRKCDLLTKRIALVIQYDGSKYCGWQKQVNGLSVQKVLEEAIEQLDPIRPVKAIAAGRTDAGVHASGQVVHFDAQGPIPIHRWPSALNGRLPKSIRVLEAAGVSAKWHACHSARYRRYRYCIFNGSRPNLFVSQWTWHRYRIYLDEPLMQTALSQLIGFHDFSAFQKAGSTRPNAWTTVEDISTIRMGDFIFVEIQATGFLYGMVRLLMGQLVAVGEHKLPIDSFEERWKQCLRSEVREAAPPNGLCLIRVGYEKQIFSDEAYFDTFPNFNLPYLDSPKLVS